MQIGTRKLLMAFLVASFATQTMLVYADDTPLQTPPLDAEELAGRELWHKHNCQVCHQVYGFGGFLGPDLTNAASRLTRERLDEILTEGSGQMPAFHMAPEEIDAIESYLMALDETGVGQARKYAPQVDMVSVEALLDEHATEGTLVGQAAVGRALFRASCTSCHRLFQATPLGPFMAPDVSDAFARLSEEEIRTVITEGRPERGMVPPALPDDAKSAIVEYLRWLQENRTSLASRLGVGEDAQSVPWFEFQ